MSEWTEILLTLFAAGAVVWAVRVERHLARISTTLGLKFEEHAARIGALEGRDA